MHGHPPQLQGDIELNDQQAKISPEANLISADLAAASNLQNEAPIQATEVSAGFDLLIVEEEVIIDELLPPDLEDLTGGITTASGHPPPPPPCQPKHRIIRKI